MWYSSSFSHSHSSASGILLLLVLLPASWHKTQLSRLPLPSHVIIYQRLFDCLRKHVVWVECKQKIVLISLHPVLVLFQLIHFVHQRKDERDIWCQNLPATYAYETWISKHYLFLTTKYRTSSSLCRWRKDLYQRILSTGPPLECTCLPKSQSHRGISSCEVSAGFWVHLATWKKSLTH